MDGWIFDLCVIIYSLPTLILPFLFFLLLHHPSLHGRSSTRVSVAPRRNSVQNNSVGGVGAMMTMAPRRQSHGTCAHPLICIVLCHSLMSLFVYLFLSQSFNHLTRWNNDDVVLRHSLMSSFIQSTNRTLIRWLITHLLITIVQPPSYSFIHTTPILWSCPLSTYPHLIDLITMFII